MELSHKNGVLQLPEEPLEDIGNVLNEVVPNPQLDFPSILPELIHQDLDPGLGPVLPVDTFMDQTCGGAQTINNGLIGQKRGLWGIVGMRFLPYWVMKARQLSTMMGMSLRLSCCSRRVFPRPPAARWMSEYHRAKSERAEPCRWSVLAGEG